MLSRLSKVPVAELAKVGEPDILGIPADLFYQLVHDCMVSLAISIIKGLRCLTPAFGRSFPWTMPLAGKGQEVPAPYATIVPTAVSTVTPNPTVAAMPFAVRPLREEDIPQVKAVEKQAFSTLFPPTSFRRELGNRAARYWVVEKRDEPGTPRPTTRPPKGIVRRFLRSARGLSQQGTPNSIVGFLGTWYAADQAHIVSVGVADGYRRRGIGELLLIAAVEHAIARETETITLEVRKSNAAARALYEKYGFIEQGIRKAYYSDNREDAVIMTTGSIQMERYATQVAALKQAHQERWGRVEIDVGT